MHTSGRQGLSTLRQPVKQKVKVYNPSLLSELLLEAEKAKQQQAQVTGVLLRVCCLQAALFSAGVNSMFCLA